MEILVTGGAGFIGAHLVRALCARRHRVTILDLRRPASPASAEAAPSVRTGSVTDTALVTELVQRAELVVHLAGIAEPLQYGADPLGTMEVNLQGSLNVARACTAAGVPIVFASTSEVYGQNPALPWAEDADRVLGSVSDVRWCYATSKAAVEHYLGAARRQRGLDYTVFRLFNVYGDGLRGRVVDAFVEQALSGGPLEVHGDGRQTRSFCYVDDAIEALVRLVEAPVHRGRTYNIGNPVETTVLELARLVIAATDSSSTIGFVPLSDLFDGFAEIRRRVPDISRITEDFGWSPRWTLVDGLQEMAALARARRCAVAPGPPSVPGAADAHDALSRPLTHGD